MNRKRKIVLWLGIFIFVWLGFNPQPYIDYKFITEPDVLDRAWIEASPERTEYFAKFDFIHKETGIKIRWGWSSKNRPKLYIYWTMIAVVTGGLIYTFKNKKDKRPQDELKQ